MDEQKERRTNVEIVDTPEQAAGNEQRVSEPMPENRTPANTAQDELAPLFEDTASEKFRSRWLAIQSRFVDDPGASVQQADELVTEVIQGITRSFADRRSSLEKGWSGGGEASTEELRLALKQYRSFFERLLTLKS